MNEKLEYLKNMLEPNQNEIRTKKMIVSKNILKFSHTTVQLSSISQINVGRIEVKVNTPYKAIAAIIVSLFLIPFNIFLGLIGIGLSALYIYNIYNNIPEDQVYLNLLLNSGNTYSIYFTDHDFAESVRSVIEDAFDGLVNTVKNIDMSENYIYDVSGENHSINSHNTVTNTDNSINDSGNNNSGNSSVGHNNSNTQSQENIKKNSDNSLDWILIQQELEKVIKAIQNNSSPVKIASENALKLAKNEDSKGFINFLKTNKNEFLSDIFVAVSSGVLVETFSKIINA